MYVFIRDEKSNRTRSFGPATYSECKAWLRRWKINLDDSRISTNRLLTEAQPQKGKTEIEK